MTIQFADEAWWEQFEHYNSRQWYCGDSLTVSRFSLASLIGSVQKARRFFPEREARLLVDELLPSELLPAPQMQTLPAGDLSAYVFVLAAQYDDSMQAIIEQLMARGGSYFGVEPFRQRMPAARYFHRQALARKILKVKMAEAFDPHFDVADTENIFQALDLTRELDGDYVEVGVFKGSRAEMAARYLVARADARPIWLIDIFAPMDYDEAQESADAAWRGKFINHDLPAVRQLFASYPQVEVVQANIITDPLPKALQKISVAHIDVDLYEATLAALQRLAPLMHPKGIMILDDIGHTPQLYGAYLAMKHFLVSAAGQGWRSIQFPTGQSWLMR